MHEERQAIHRWSGRAVLVLSVFATLLVLGASILTMLGRFQPAPDGDEGTPAHLFQIAIVLIVPAGLAHLGTADWRRPLRVMRGLVVPAIALVVAFATLYRMEHLR